MNDYERQMLATEKFCVDAIRAAGKEDVEMLSSVVAGSMLHEKMHNLVADAINEG
jgi:hypothetical protein